MTKLERLERENAELRETAMKCLAAVREIAWIGLVWNDHNFTDEMIREKVDTACKLLGFGDNFDGPDKFNKWLSDIQKRLAPNGPDVRHRPEK